MTGGTIDQREVSKHMDEETEKRHRHQKRVVDFLLGDTIAELDLNQFVDESDRDFDFLEQNKNLARVYERRDSPQDLDSSALIDDILSKLMTVRIKMQMQRVHRFEEMSKATIVCSYKGDGLQGKNEDEVEDILVDFMAQQIEARHKIFLATGVKVEENTESRWFDQQATFKIDVIFNKLVNRLIPYNLNCRHVDKSTGRQVEE